MEPMNDETLVRVAVWVCRACLQDSAGECHSPGCLFWLHDDTQRPSMEHRYEDTGEACTP